MTTGKEVATLTPRDYAEKVMEFLQHGDITKLPIDAQLRLYEEKSQEIGMTAMDRPFSIINLKGKMTLYLTAFAANRFAADKNIVRTIVGKPCIEDLNGKPAIYVHIRGTLNGRTEEDHYWREIANDSSIMVQMSKAQSAARRRVTMLFMSPRALQGVISEDDIYQLGLDAGKTDESAVTRIIDARATVTEERQEATQETVAPAPTLVQVKEQVAALCEQFAISPLVIKHWCGALGLKPDIAGMTKIAGYMEEKDGRARPSLYSWGLKNLFTPDTLDHLFDTAIQHKEPGVTSWAEWWGKVQSNPDDWASKIADMASEAVPQPAA